MIYAGDGIMSVSDKDRVHWPLFSGTPKVSSEMPEVQTGTSKRGVRRMWTVFWKSFFFFFFLI